MIKIGSVKVCGGECGECGRFSCLKQGNSVALIKKKVSRKYMPPDMSAIKLLNEINGDGIKSVIDLSDEELMSLQRELTSKLNNA